jgi:hypothetical protein
MVTQYTKQIITRPLRRKHGLNKLSFHIRLHKIGDYDQRFIINITYTLLHF